MYFRCKVPSLGLQTIKYPGCAKNYNFYDTMIEIFGRFGFGTVVSLAQNVSVKWNVLMYTRS